ncbi:hypothetical protein AFE_1748 [Acidithiobacillus ferrooxidans ATCC 23270]|uniref:Uncharacterized protein n=1 Tax=Acidithiobacillus ferrooxidans (strain ATCC 23270 / DSM 14882 / CIP 104768 / NCIMB 8455) TaxID=243159 RepID=B7JBK6_ACIF2|nr:hypothetical protein AFE_1748 [Acidithiobacillus ferrooxidans ATCC 23270]
MGIGSQCMARLPILAAIPFLLRCGRCRPGARGTRPGDLAGVLKYGTIPGRIAWRLMAQPAGPQRRQNQDQQPLELLDGFRVLCLHLNALCSHVLYIYTAPSQRHASVLPSSAFSGHSVSPGSSRPKAKSLLVHRNGCCSPAERPESFPRKSLQAENRVPDESAAHEDATRAANGCDPAPKAYVGGCAARQAGRGR